MAGGDHDKADAQEVDQKPPRRIYGLRNARAEGQQYKDNKEVYQGASEAVAEVNKPDRQQNAEDYQGGIAVFISKHNFYNINKNDCKENTEDILHNQGRNQFVPFRRIRCVSDFPLTYRDI